MPIAWIIREFLVEDRKILALRKTIFRRQIAYKSESHVELVHACLCDPAYPQTIKLFQCDLIIVPF